jgi:molybdenum cofactor cytidylyltransferase
MISAVVLASGFSTRFGSDKLLSDFKGKAVIRWVLDNCLDSRLEEIIVVYRRTELLGLLRDLPIRLIHNEMAHSGMSASVKLGISSLSSTSTGCMILMGDQPLFGKDDINLMIDKFSSNEVLIATSHNGKRKNPVIFPSKYYADLLATSGDKGGRDIIDNDPDKMFIEFDAFKLMDIDTINDLEQLIIDVEEIL